MFLYPSADCSSRRCRRTGGQNWKGGKNSRVVVTPSNTWPILPVPHFLYNAEIIFMYFLKTAMFLGTWLQKCIIKNYIFHGFCEGNVSVFFAFFFPSCTRFSLSVFLVCPLGRSFLIICCHACVRNLVFNSGSVDLRHSREVLKVFCEHNCLGIEYIIVLCVWKGIGIIANLRVVVCAKLVLFAALWSCSQVLKIHVWCGFWIFSTNVQFPCFFCFSRKWKIKNVFFMIGKEKCQLKCDFYFFIFFCFFSLFPSTAYGKGEYLLGNGQKILTLKK